MSAPAIITRKENPSLELYIHYGDDKDMIQQIVDIAHKNNARNINCDEYYGMARLCCACQEYFENEETGFGIAPYGKEYHDYHYVIDKYWHVELIEDDYI